MSCLLYIQSKAQDTRGKTTDKLFYINHISYPAEERQPKKAALEKHMFIQLKLTYERIF